MATAKKTDSFFEIGKCYMIRTVTMFNLGRIKAINDMEILLEEASWIADTGRYHQALKNGVLNEIEPYADGLSIVGRGAIVDAQIWTHSLPTEVK